MLAANFNDNTITRRPADLIDVMFEQTYFKAEEVDAVVHCSCNVNDRTLCHLYQLEFQAEKYVVNNYSRFDSEVEFCLRNLHRFFTRGKTVSLLF